MFTMKTKKAQAVSQTDFPYQYLIWIALFALLLLAVYGIIKLFNR